MNGRLLGAADEEWGSALDRAQHDFYHLPGYVALCAKQEGGRAHAIYVEDGSRAMLLPLVIRPIGSGEQDATSPYGYGGPILIGTDDAGFLRDAFRTCLQLLESEGVISLLVRLHPLLNRVLPEGVGTLVEHGHTVTVDLTLSAEVLWEQTRRDHRYGIEQSLLAGFHAGIDDTWVHFETFKRLYRDTMSRVSASGYYFFDEAYFRDLRNVLGDRLKLAVVTADGTVAAAGLFVETAGCVQYHLSASDERFAKFAPTKLMIHFARGWAKERGDRWLHLGGGRGATDDSLLNFKAGFSPLRFPFHTLRLVVIESEYRRLVAAHQPTADPSQLDGFFPAYRRDEAAEPRTAPVPPNSAER